MMNLEIITKTGKEYIRRETAREVLDAFFTSDTRNGGYLTFLSEYARGYLSDYDYKWLVKLNYEHGGEIIALKRYGGDVEIHYDDGDFTYLTTVDLDGSPAKMFLEVLEALRENFKDKEPVDELDDEDFNDTSLNHFDE